MITITITDNYRDLISELHNNSTYSVAYTVYKNITY